MGLRVMHHRARMIGATISVRQPKEGGITVTCSISRVHATKKKPETLHRLPQKNQTVSEKRPAERLRAQVGF
jgi:hypothetical protein